MGRQHVLVAFTTLTFQDGEIPTGFEESFKTYIDKRAVACCAVRESGKYGGNSHYHMYIVFRNVCSTDSFTRSLRNLYPKGLDTGRYTVLTLKEKDPLYRIGYYFTKEADFVKVFVKNLNMDYYIEEYKKRRTLAQSLIGEKNYTKYKLNELPSVYLVYCHGQDLKYNDFEYNYGCMIRDGFITLSQIKHLKYVTEYVNVLKGDNLSKDLTFLKPEINFL